MGQRAAWCAVAEHRRGRHVASAAASIAVGPLSGGGPVGLTGPKRALVICPCGSGRARHEQAGWPPLGSNWRVGRRQVRGKG
jgi:hypothetical protein